MTNKTPGGIRHTYTHRSLSKVRFLLPTLFLSLFSLTFLFLLSPTQFVLGEQGSSAGTASASSNDTGAFTVTGGAEGTDYAYANGILTIKTATPITIKNTNQTTPTTDRIEVTGEANITLAGVNISTNNGAPISIGVSGNVTVLLEDGSTNTLKATRNGYPGIFKGDGDHMLTIGVPSDSQGNGVLISTGAISSAGIGGRTGGGAKNIVITGGIITATGGAFAAGIGGGGGNSTDTSDIKISGGTVTAIGGQNGAGIGGGDSRSGSNITISGGTVTATGGSGGAGIGGGDGGSGDDIKITDGTVSATGGDGAAGIGGGNDGSGSKITISRGDVKACGKNAGAGIGGGLSGNGTDITVSSGTVTATGGYFESAGQKGSGAGIGSGATGSASQNKLSGNAIVLATSGLDDFSVSSIKPQLDGFADSDITGGLVFTGIGTYEIDPEGTWVLKSTAWNDGEQYGDVTITKDVTFPANLTVMDDKKLTIGEKATVTVEDGTILQNEGIILFESSGTIACVGNGKVTTLLDYDPQGGSINTNDDAYITYQDASGVKKYEDLPEATKEGYDFDGWYTKASGEGTKVKEGDTVLLNEHVLYASWVQPAPSPDPEPSEKSGWELDDTGWRYFVNNDAITGWKWIDDTYGAHWYFFGDDTYMVTSTFLKDNGHTYWVCSTGPMITSLWQWIDNEWYGFWWDGKMCTGWVWDTDWNAWFYCYQNGIMARSTWIDAYWVDWRGVWLH